MLPPQRRPRIAVSTDKSASP